MITDVLMNSPVRKIGLTAVLKEGTAVSHEFTESDALVEVTLERAGDENKFFGFGVCQKINVKLIDSDRSLNITTANSFELRFGYNDATTEVCPTFNVSEVHRDEKTNQLSVTAYDSLYKANSFTLSEIGMPEAYTLKTFADKIAEFIGKQVLLVNVADNSFDLEFPTGANIDGTETLREALNAIAEATQTIYYLTRDELVFKRLSPTPVFSITKDDYFELQSKTNRKLTTIVNATELGDNTSLSTGQTGSTQYVRDNPFWELREDIATLLERAIAAVGNFTINQFDCSWRGNYNLEIGDCISLITKDDQEVISYILNDSIKYDGTLTERSQWNYTDSDETESNPATLGDALKQTFAKVDKANKKIDLVASEAEEAYSRIELTTDDIKASVSETSQSIDDLTNEVSTLTESVNTRATPEEVSIQIQEQLESGIDKVVTNTGFTFDEDGLRIEKSDSEMKTQITEDGMTIYKDSTGVLTADNTGVSARNLHANTYLVIGNNSRFEDYKIGRTGCFFIG